MKKLPHIFRFLPAETYSLALTMLIFLITVGIFTSNVISLNSQSNSFWQIYTFYPNQLLNSATHIDLARNLFNQGLTKEAKYELTQAQNIINKTNHSFMIKSKNNAGVLGTTTLSEYWQSWQDQKNQIQKSYNYWLDQVQNKPDYIDGYLYLAYYAYRLGDNESSKAYLQQAEALNPANVNLNQLKQVLVVN